MRKRKSDSNKDILVFLDIDGVLNTTHSLDTRYEVCGENVKAFKLFKEKLVKRGYNVKIVLTSTWRLGYDSNVERCSPQIRGLMSKLAQFDITIEDRTPLYKEKSRDVEIRRYLREYELKNPNFTYLILDDDVSLFDEKKLANMMFYQVNYKSGLTKNDIGKIMNMLK